MRFISVDFEILLRNGSVPSPFVFPGCSGRFAAGGDDGRLEPNDASNGADWSSGWTTSGDTGWNYVGQVNGASGVYLGDGWVLTAGHVGSGLFTLEEKSYSPITGSEHTLTNGEDTADLTLFQISTSPDLNPLVVSDTAPEAFLDGDSGSSVVILGYGGGVGETWGENTVDQVNQPITPTGFTFVSNDFLTVNGALTSEGVTTTNEAMLVSGDSGGGDFILNTSTGMWELAGINEVTGSEMIGDQEVTYSGFVQLDAYQKEIDSITGLGLNQVPEPSTWMLMLASLLVLAGFARRCRAKQP